MWWCIENYLANVLVACRLPQWLVISMEGGDLFANSDTQQFPGTTCQWTGAYTFYPSNCQKASRPVWLRPKVTDLPQVARSCSVFYLIYSVNLANCFFYLSTLWFISIVSYYSSSCFNALIISTLIYEIISVNHFFHHLSSAFKLLPSISTFHALPQRTLLDQVLLYICWAGALLL